MKDAFWRLPFFSPKHHPSHKKTTKKQKAAGGASSDGARSILELLIEDTAGRTVIALGSKEQVEACLPALRDAGSDGGAAPPSR